MKPIDLLIPGILLLACACAAPQGRHGTGPAAGAEACRAAYALVDETVRDLGVGDAEAGRIEGFPHLRVNRFLASFRRETLPDEAFAYWAENLRRLDRQARHVELANLPAQARRALAERLGEDPSGALERCGAVLLRHDLSDETARAALRAAARVPDHYATWARLIGLYPVTSIGVAVGYAAWRRETLDLFNGEADGARPAAVTAYLPASAETVAPERIAALIAGSRDNPLAIPELSGPELRRIVEGLAPVWQVETAGPADLIGRPVWRRGAEGLRVEVDAASPVAFARLSHARFGGRVLPQISYSVWFPERPGNGALDILAGRLDSVVWRVTLGPDGRPLLYDSIHGCGCYHLFFPVAPTERRPVAEDRDLREEAIVPAPGPLPGPGERVVLRLTAGSHYLKSVTAAASGRLDGRRAAYALLPLGEVPDRELRSAPLPAAAGGGRRSIFAPDGLVEGSERLERFLLWPMGIASAGAMRQWGTHATAFVGRRHFDDPHMLDRAFRR